MRRILTLYENSIIGRREAIKALIALGYKAETAAWMVDKAKPWNS